MFNRYNLQILIPVLLIGFLSLLTLSTISSTLLKFQFYWYLVGIIIIFIFLVFDWRLIFNYRWIIFLFYGLVNILLVLTYFFSPIRHIHGWIHFGSFTFEPAELAKIALILVYAEYFSRRHLTINSFKVIVGSFAFFALPAALIFFEPDFGSAFVLFCIWFSFLVLSGLSAKKILIFILIFAILGLLMWLFFLKPYQKERVISFLNPQANSLTSNYNINQAKIAIGSSGLFGKGYFGASQTRLGFLPESSADFIFSAFTEEWGLFGAGLLLAIFAYLVFSILNIGLKADTNFEKFICLGGAVVFIIQFWLNLGSNLGLSPAVGLTFPFFSYGGSSLLTSFLIISIINSIAKRF